ncbi:MAG: hypothetical protein U9R42_14765, partial [Bacteroidota bacterium]|nr:hypothetical protein [Bacteroidota bacterium]
MRFKIIFIISFFLIVSTINSNAQKEASWWYFGQKSGIHFSKDTIKADTNGQISTTYSCASISDKDGNLLFYTNGDQVWNKQHDSMKNGANISISNPWLTNKFSNVSIIIPHPGNKQQYYIFSINNIHGFSSTGSHIYYSIIDMSFENGIGKVISKNNLLLSDVCFKLTAIHHSNKKSVWLVTHTVNNNSFYSFLINKDGINLNPITSNVGSSHITTAPVKSYKYGNLKISPNGEKIVSLKSTPKTGIYAQTNFEVFDFNTANGKVSNPLSTIIQYPYYCEFSSNGQYLYLRIGGQLFQYDFSKIDSLSFFNSKRFCAYPSSAMQLQLGMDGRIYIGKFGIVSNPFYYLGVINEPNKEGISCNYIDSGLYLGGRKVEQGLPFFLQSYFFKP